MLSKCLKQVKVVIGGTHFWVMLLLLTLCNIYHYSSQLGLSTTLFPDLLFGLTRHTVDRVFYLVPIIYAVYIFGAAIGLVITFLALLLMLPRILFISPSPPDALFETAIVILIGILASLWFRTRTEQTKVAEQHEQVTEAMITAQTKLHAQIQDTLEYEKKLTALSNLSSLLVQSLEMESLLNSAIELVMEIMRVEVALIFSLEEKTSELVLIAYDGVPQRFAQAVDRMKLGEGFNGRVAEIGEPLLVEDASQDPRLTREAVREENLQTQLIAPMKCRGRVVGTLCVAMRHHREFAVEEIELLAAISNQIGIAIENARLYQEQVVVTRQLHQSEENLHFYVQQITRAQEEERLRIARELHDNTAQSLIALLYQLENLLRDKAELLVSEAGELWTFHRQIKNILQEIRHISRDLRPPILDDAGVVVALQWAVRELKTECGIEASLQLHGVERRFSQEAGLLLFRIVQEALRNIAKHSHASKAEILIRFEEGKTAVTIRDNGVGFQPPDKISDLSRSGKLGLVGMQERVQLLGGSLKLESEPGKGTSIIVEAPM